MVDNVEITHETDEEKELHGKYNQEAIEKLLKEVEGFKKEISELKLKKENHKDENKESFNEYNKAIENNTKKVVEATQLSMQVQNLNFVNNSIDNLVIKHDSIFSEHSKNIIITALQNIKEHCLSSRIDYDTGKRQVLDTVFSEVFKDKNDNLNKLPQTKRDLFEGLLNMNEYERFKNIINYENDILDSLHSLKMLNDVKNESYKFMNIPKHEDIYKEKQEREYKKLFEGHI